MSDFSIACIGITVLFVLLISLARYQERLDRDEQRKHPKER